MVRDHLLLVEAGPRRDAYSNVIASRDAMQGY